MMRSTRPGWGVAFALTLAVLGCGPGSVGDATTSSGTLGSETGTGDGDTGITAAPTATVDLLFVIDNSGSMGSVQGVLQSSVGALVAELEAANADYRIGITTSDNGNPWCPPGGPTTPEAGELVLSSCTTRLEDFGLDAEAVDPYLACTGVCLLSPAEVEIQPTTTSVDAIASARPWVEKIGGQTNLPQGTDVVEALRCFLPQGINGCGFESQLESMYLALSRAEDADADSYGFLRPEAVLAIIIVTDEADCSYNDSFAEIFEQDGNRAFWSDPAAEFPTSAVCWNAGVDCVGDPSNYDSCSAVNKDIDGNSGVTNNDAVLYPVSRYVGLLEGIEQEKQFLTPNREIVFAVIGGVPDDGVPVYGDATGTDPQFQNQFGIGPGCERASFDSPIQAVPPVRMRDVGDAFTPGGLYSVCATDYTAPMAAVAQQIIAQF